MAAEGDAGGASALVTARRRLGRWYAALRRLALRSRLLAARRASQEADWPLATIHWRGLARLHPDRAAMLVQLGHALKESGRPTEAATAYRAAASAGPGDVDVRVHLAALCRGDGADEAAAAVYAEILAIDPGHAGALRGLAELGQRRLIPVRSLDLETIADRLEQAGRLEREAAAIRVGVERAAIPVEHYDLFRRRHPVPPPPASGMDAPVFDVVVLAGRASAAMLRATLDGIAGQSIAIGRVLIVAGERWSDQPVASVLGDRPTFLSPKAAARELAESGAALALCAGTRLDGQACAWLAHGLSRGGVPCYGDHDVAVAGPEGLRAHVEPMFFPIHDAPFVAGTPDPPIVVASDGGRLAEWLCREYGQASPDAIRRLISTSSEALHIPRRLASRYRLPAVAKGAPELVPNGPEGSSDTRAPLIRQSHGGDDIAVLIPSRDQPILLRGMIDSLRAKAARPDRLDLVVIDNRGSEPATRSELARLAEEGVRVTTFDEPFNWSRANNLGVASTDAPILAFVNDDMEMLSDGWDMALRHDLGTEEARVVGAKLLYPDHLIQHAGVLFGVGAPGEITHDGLGRPDSDPGPGGRWVTRRRCMAVTGAFLACRRSTFDVCGGFDEQLAVGYNDIDFCLKVGRAGGTVLYEPAIALIHHESRTRGRNVARAQVAWDEEERHILMRRWHPLDVDPAYNPQWAIAGRPFDGLREPAEAEVMRRIDHGLSPRPWMPWFG